MNQLTRVDDGEQNKTYTYAYDVYGNILSKSEYALTDSSSEPTNPLSTISYGYSDSNWTDKMTSYNGQAITYDEIGNPLSYDGWTFVWESGRQLKRMTKDGSTIDYKYDDNGIRTSKTVNGVTTNYTTIDGRITSQNDGTNFLYFRYDSNNELVGVQINGTEYIYLKNLQGDVVSILDMNGQSVVNYTYDAWGKITSISGSMADTIGNLNPMRYRGYYFDNESGYYYLQSRYYDSNTCRFINADESSVLELTKDQAVGHNLFAYALNNPVINTDMTGELVQAIVGGIIGAIIGAFTYWLEWKLGMRKWRKLIFAGHIALSAGLGAAGALTGALIACNLPAPATNLGRGIVGMMASLGHSIRQGHFKTISGAFKAIGQAVLSGAITVIIGSVRAKYGKTLNYNSVKQMITKIGINRALRGGIRLSLGWGWAKIKITIN